MISLGAPDMHASVLGAAVSAAGDFHEHDSYQLMSDHLTVFYVAEVKPSSIVYGGGSSDSSGGGGGGSEDVQQTIFSLSSQNGLFAHIYPEESSWEQLCGYCMA